MQVDESISSRLQYTYLHDGLPSCPKTEKLIHSVTAITQAPWEISLLAALGNYSTLIQGLANVEKIQGKGGALGLFILIIAASGERKTTVFDLLNQTIIDFQQEEAKRLENQLIEYEIDSEIIDEKIKHLKKAIVTAVKSDKESSLNDLKQKLKTAKSGYPKKPTELNIVFEDITPEATLHQLGHGWPNVALISNEGGTILQGRAMQKLPLLNNLWSGEPCSVYRKSSPNYTVMDARLTLVIAGQPSAVEKYMRKKGEESVGIGFTGRLIVSNPQSTQGQRFIKTKEPDIEEGLHEHNELARELLLEISERHKSDCKRDTIRWSHEAKELGMKIYNDIELELGPGGRFEHAQEHGNKLFENIGRIAALLTYVELGKDKDISVGILRDAINIAFYFSRTYLNHFKVLPDHISDIHKLDVFFNTQRSEGQRYIMKNKARQNGPNPLRTPGRFDAALEASANNGSIRVYRVERTGLILIDLYPQYDVDYPMLEQFQVKNNLSPSNATDLYTGRVVQILPRPRSSL